MHRVKAASRSFRVKRVTKLHPSSFPTWGNKTETLSCQRGGQERLRFSSEVWGTLFRHKTAAVHWCLLCFKGGKKQRKRLRVKAAHWHAALAQKKKHLCEWEWGDEQVKITKREAGETQEVNSRLIFLFFPGWRELIKSRKKYLRNERRVIHGAAVFCSHGRRFRLGAFLPHCSVSPRCRHVTRHLWEDTEGLSPD